MLPHQTRPGPHPPAHNYPLLPNTRQLHPYLPPVAPPPPPPPPPVPAAPPSDDDEHEHDDGQAPKKRRRRQPLSCTECKRRKIRCDRNQPCAPCVRRGDQPKCQWHVIEPATEKYVPAPNTTRSASVSTPSKRSSTASKRPPRPCPRPSLSPTLRTRTSCPAHNPLQPPPARNAARGRGHRLWEHHRHHHWEHHRHHHWDLHLHLHLHIHLIHEPPRVVSTFVTSLLRLASTQDADLLYQPLRHAAGDERDDRPDTPRRGQKIAPRRRATPRARACACAAGPGRCGCGWLFFGGASCCVWRRVDGAGDAGASEGRGDGTLRIDVNMHPSPPLSPGSASSPFRKDTPARVPPREPRRRRRGGTTAAHRLWRCPPPGDFTSARRPSEQQRRRASLGAAGYLTMGARDAPHPRLSPPAGVRLSPRAQHMMSPPPAPREPLSPRDDQGAGAGAVEGWMWRGGGVGRQGREEGREGGINCVARGVVVFALAFARARVLLAFLFCRCCPGFPDFLPSFPPSLLPPTGLSYRPSSSLSPACFLRYLLLLMSCLSIVFPAFVFIISYHHPHRTRT
ncbi:hypothetical protein B0H10DRAFT_2434258 [Mycena sp. CBHHK59/15]|nr:hypothetical protein B0H10DRAFT_2434258 [Mycena sp. CBHHK59/15]